MRKQLLLSTAALLAGMTIASAQGMSGAQSSGSASGQERAQSTQSRSGQAQQGAQELNKQGQSQRSEGRSQREQTTGQASQSQQREQGKQAQQPGRSEREQATKQNQPSQRDQTQGQAARQRNQGQAAGRQQTQPQQGKAAQQTQQGKAQQGKVQQAQPQQGFTAGQTQSTAQAQGRGTVSLSADQQAKIRETVLARSDVPRLNTVNFALNVGAVVPGSVRIVEVPETLISIHPEWRGDMYFVVRDDIVIVDHSHRIVALLPVGSSGARASGFAYGSSAPGSAMAMHLGRDEIRQVQIMLNQKGFNIGEPDGILGERTRSALIQFQRQQGFQASGQIDQQTMGALGVSQTGGRQGQQTQPSSTGQAGRTMNQPSANTTKPPGANQGTAAGQPSTQGAAQPSTAGQAGRTQQPAANPNQGTGTNGQSQTPQNMNSNTGSGSSMPQQHTR
jgi:hypothetical protein